MDVAGERRRCSRRGCSPSHWVGQAGTSVTWGGGGVSIPRPFRLQCPALFLGCTELAALGNYYFLAKCKQAQGTKAEQNRAQVP